MDVGARAPRGSGQPESELIDHPDRAQSQAYALSVRAQITIILISWAL
jgi:hypothetical protein